MEVIPKAVLLDLDNTLYDYELCNEHATECVVEAIAREAGISSKDVFEAYHDSRKTIKQQVGLIASSHSRLLYIKHLLDTLHKKTRASFALELHDLFWKSYFEKMTLYKNARLFIEKARLKNIKLIIVTDHALEIQLRKLIHLGIQDSMDYIITSEEAGKEKPAIDIFHLALAKSACKAQQCLVVGDSLEKDGEGAKRCQIPFFCASSDADFARLIKELKM